MKRGLALFTVALSLTLSASMAQAAKLMIEANGGASIPMGDFADKDKGDAKTGFLVGGAVSYMVNDQFAVGVDGMWGQNKHAGEGSTAPYGVGQTITAEKDKYPIWQVGAHGKYIAPGNGKVHPFGLVGAGIYNIKEDYEYRVSDGTVFTDESASYEQQGSRFGGKVGLGAMLDVTPKVSVGVQGDYNFVSLDKNKGGGGSSSLQFIGVRGQVVFSIMQP